MTAERAIEKLKDLKTAGSNLIPSCGERAYVVTEAIAMAIKALERQRWIPVSERLPDTGTEVLVMLGYTYESDYTMYSIARNIIFEDGECHWCDNRYGYLEWDKYSDGRGGNSSYKVLAWQPLPEPFKE